MPEQILPLPERRFYSGSNRTTGERIMKEILTPSVVSNTTSAALAVML